MKVVGIGEDNCGCSFVLITAVVKSQYRCTRPVGESYAHVVFSDVVSYLTVAISF